MSDKQNKRILVAGATGYLGKYVVKAFKAQGYYVRILARKEKKIYEPGPFTAPALTKADTDDIFIGEVSKPESLTGLLDSIDMVFSCVGISRQRDGLTFDQVDYQCNKNLIDLCKNSKVKRFVYVSMQGAENIKHLAITKAHEKVVEELLESSIEYRIVRPCGYFSDMGALYDMAKKGKAYMIGKGNNKMNPIHGQDLAYVCVETAEGSEIEVEAGGPDILTQKEAIELAFEVLGKTPKITIIPFWLAKALVKLISLLSKQFGDLADFIVTAGEIDGIGPVRGKTSLKSYFEDMRVSDLNNTK
jgi:uncharacterized protein YbjT (DUF2867 family)